MPEKKYTIVPAHPGWLALSHVDDGLADEIGDPIIAWLVVMLPPKSEERSDQPPPAFSVPITAEGTYDDYAALKQPDGRVVIPHVRSFPTMEDYAKHLLSEKAAKAA